MKRPSFPVAALLLLALTPQAALAAGTAPAAANEAGIEEAAFYFNVMMSALHSEKIPEPIKDALFSCIYSNSMGQISGIVTKAMTEKKLDRTNPDQVLAVMAGICGYDAKPATGQPNK